MQIELWHYNFKLLANAIDTLANRDFESAEIDELLNTAINFYVNGIWEGFRITGKAFEESPLTFNSLHTLVKTVTVPIVNNKATYPTDYRFFIRAKGEITDCKNVDLILTEQDHLHTKLNDYTVRPNLKWARALVTLEDAITIHTNNEFVVNNCLLTYIKEPAQVTIGGYNNINGVLKVKTESDLPASSHLKVVSEAVKLAQGILENSAGFQIASERTQTNL